MAAISKYVLTAQFLGETLEAKSVHRTESGRSPGLWGSFTNAKPFPVRRTSGHRHITPITVALPQRNFTAFPILPESRAPDRLRYSIVVEKLTHRRVHVNQKKFWGSQTRARLTLPELLIIIPNNRRMLKIESYSRGTINV